MRYAFWNVLRPLCTSHSMVDDVPGTREDILEIQILIKFKPSLPYYRDSNCHSWAKFKIILVRKLGRKFYYRQFSYNAVLLYRGILSNTFFFQTKNCVKLLSNAVFREMFEKVVKKNCQNKFSVNFFFVKLSVIQCNVQ